MLNNSRITRVRSWKLSNPICIIHGCVFNGKYSICLKTILSLPTSFQELISRCMSVGRSKRECSANQNELVGEISDWVTDLVGARRFHAERETPIWRCICFTKRRCILDVAIYYLTVAGATGVAPFLIPFSSKTTLAIRHLFVHSLVLNDDFKPSQTTTKSMTNYKRCDKINHSRIGSKYIDC